MIALALVFKPTGFLGHWKQLANVFETHRNPSRFSFPNQRIYVGYLSEHRLHWFPWQRRSWQIDGGEYALFDVECDEEGLWLNHKGDTESKCPEMMQIPWPYINVRKEYENQIVLKVATEYFVDFRMERELGDVCIRYIKARTQRAFQPAVNDR